MPYSYFGQAIAFFESEEKLMTRYLTTILLGAALAGPIAMVPLHAADRVYHDRDHNDDHHWNNHEDRAYRMWVKENHRHYNDFRRLRPEDQQAYWGWRHEHSDAILKINIR
jgi:hypothetical protein